MIFLNQLFKRPIETGAIAPTSKKLSKLIVETANLSNKRCVVELGPGTGVFTREIMNNIPETSEYFSLEINEEFVKETKLNNPKATVYHASAKDIKKYLTKHNQVKSDCIISGLPWGALAEDVQVDLLDEVFDSLEEGGEFLTIALLQGLVFPPGRRFKKAIKEKFRKVEKTKIVWSNIPPGFVYHCIK